MKIVFKGAISDKDKVVINETLDYLSEKLSPVFSSITLSHLTIEIEEKLDSMGKVNFGKEHYNEHDGVYYWQPTITLRKDVVEKTDMFKAVVCHEFMHFIDYVKNPFVRMFHTFELWEFMELEREEARELKLEYELGWDNWIDERLAKIGIENPQKQIIKKNRKLIEWHTPSGL